MSSLFMVAGSGVHVCLCRLTCMCDRCSSLTFMFRSRRPSHPVQRSSALPFAPLPRTRNRTPEIWTPSPAKSSDRSHVTLIPGPVIRAHWGRLACSATLDWMIPIYPRPSIPRRSPRRQELPVSSVCLSPDLLEASVSLVTEPADPWP